MTLKLKFLITGASYNYFYNQRKKCFDLNNMVSAKALSALVNQKDLKRNLQKRKVKSVFFRF
jgi:hypothetical protein